MVIEGKNGCALKKLKSKKEALIAAVTLVGIVHKAGEDRERYIQTHPELPVKVPSNYPGECLHCTSFSQ
jgi:hypothetical protein